MVLNHRCETIRRDEDRKILLLTDFNDEMNQNRVNLILNLKFQVLNNPDFQRKLIIRQSRNNKRKVFRSTLVRYEHF